MVFLEIDGHMRVMSEKKHGTDRNGSTAVGVLSSPQNTYFINCRDSKSASKGPEFKSQQPHGGSQPLVMRSDTLFWCVCDSHSVLIYNK
jgi:protein phosphatase 1A